ncbi:MAG: DegT/DnrJ/EryC1/StrS family aminotransferase, partial [bacterium]
LGAIPVYVDIDPKTFNIDPAKIEAAITPRTKAIIPVHLYGQAAEMDPIMEIARRHNLKVIEDSAQAMGASYKGRKVCTFGDVSCISYFPSKNLGAFGDAGMIVTNNVELGEKIRMIIAHGSKVRYYHEILGVNSRLDTLQAVILSVKLKYLDQWNAARRKAAARYNELLNETPVTVPYVSSDCEHIFHQYTIRAPKRNGLAEHLKQKGIPHAIYYPVPLHLQKAFSHARNSQVSFSITDKAADDVLSLPMHTELNEDQLVTITDSIKEFYKSN